MEEVLTSGQSWRPLSHPGGGDNRILMNLLFFFFLSIFYLLTDSSSVWKENLKLSDSQGSTPNWNGPKHASRRRLGSFQNQAGEGQKLKGGRQLLSWLCPSTHGLALVPCSLAAIMPWEVEIITGRLFTNHSDLLRRGRQKTQHARHRKVKGKMLLGRKLQGHLGNEMHTELPPGGSPLCSEMR